MQRVRGLFSRSSAPKSKLREKCEAAPEDGWLVHPAFGFRPYESQALPLVERDLPSEFTALKDDERDRALDEWFAVVMEWAASVSCDQMFIEVIGSDRAVAQRIGLQPTDKYHFEGPFTVERGVALLRCNPVALCVFRGDRLMLFQHETWDSVVVSGNDAEISLLRAQLKPLS